MKVFHILNKLHIKLYEAKQIQKLLELILWKKRSSLISLKSYF
jgi:hypothetical protein